MNQYSLATDYSRLAGLAQERYGKAAYRRVVQLQAKINELRNASDLEKLKGINDFFNNEIEFDEDINIWGQQDYWATPLEMIGKDRGDCEDFAIAKYVFLRELNIPNDKLKLTYVKAQLGGPSSNIFQAHMILSYYPTPSAEPLILDNLISDIRPASRRSDLTPVYNFNSEGLWLSGAGATSSYSINNLSRWKDVLQRIQADGIEQSN